MATPTLHTKYRPADFDGVLGQDDTVKSIKRVLAKSSCQAFIFTGPSGTGKTTLARIIARHVGCPASNLLEVDGATYTGIDAMRELAEGLQYAPLGGSKKMVIVDEAHRLSRQAWDCLLKPIEEPPAHVFWCFCTTEPLKIPNAIRTRCVQYETKAVKRDQVRELLERVRDDEGYKTPDDVLALIAEKCQGSVRLALTALAQCSACSDRRSAADIIKAASEEGDVIDLCRALLKGASSWSTMVKLVEPLKEQNGEGVRLTIIAYFTKVLMGTSSDKQAAYLLNILQAFSDPYPQGAGVAHVLLSLGQVVFSG